MFIRFVVKEIDRNSGRRQGLFQAADALERNGSLTRADADLIENIGDWFDKHLKRPKRFAVSAKPHAKKQAISWFRDSATSHIAKMREFQKALERHDVIVEVIIAERPGYVLYEDEFQVVAYPFKETQT